MLILAALLEVNSFGTLFAGESIRESVSLNGLWDFYPDGDGPKHEIRVPSFWDAPQDYGYPSVWANLQYGVYRRQLQIPVSLCGREIFLSIQRVSVIAKVRINGHQVGAKDSGGYLMMQLPYLIDLTPYINVCGTNTIEVLVLGGKIIPFRGNAEDTFVKENDYPSDAMSDGRLLYPCCVENWDGRLGINGDVSLVAYPKTYVSDVFVITDLLKNTNHLDDEITLRLTLENRDIKAHKIQVRNHAHLLGGNSIKDFESPEVVLPPHSTMTVAIPNVKWPNAVYWWPDKPRLYALETTLTEGGKTVDACQTRFGFRQFYVNGDHYELNGVRVNLRGDSYEFSWHENYIHGPSTAPEFSTKELMSKYQEKLVREYQKLNNNVLRIHKASNIESFYDTCDEIGMMVIDEAPFWETWLRTDGRAKTNFEAWVQRWIRERRNHPSIVAWDAANECWYGPIGMYSVMATRATDPTRPVFQDDPWGPKPHEDPLEPYPGDEDCHHYTGGYPFGAVNTNGLYDVYHADPNKPTGEGEAMYADGWPLMNPDGTLSGNRSKPGEFGNPDMISQAQWVRATCRMIRAMRYAGLSDSRLYADWMYAFDPIEANFKLNWKDLNAPGIKPVIMRRPILNLFSNRYPVVRYNDAYDYYQDTFAPVAVFDKEADQYDRIGANPLVFKPHETLTRTVVVYNDDFHGSDNIAVHWLAVSDNPIDDSSHLITQGEVAIQVPYGEKRERQIRFQLPDKLEGARWLDFVLTAFKAGREQFCETNRLGAIVSVPLPKLVVFPQSINLGEVDLDNLSQWHVIRLKNLGGGLSERWTLSGGTFPLHFNLKAGNLRGEQEIYFQISTNGLQNSDYHRTVRFIGESGTSDHLQIQFSVHETSPH